MLALTVGSIWSTRTHETLYGAVFFSLLSFLHLNLSFLIYYSALAKLSLASSWPKSRVLYLSRYVALPTTTGQDYGASGYATSYRLRLAGLRI